METLKKFLCIVIDRETKATLAEYDDIKAKDWYYARHIAANKYRQEHGEGDWCVDSLEL